MNILLLYDYRPRDPYFPSSGLQALGWYTATWLRKIGHNVVEDNLFQVENDKALYSQPDLILWIGYWGDAKYVPHVDKCDKTVGYLVTDGQIPAKYRDILNEMAGTIALSKKCEDILKRDGIKNTHMAYPGIDPMLFQPKDISKRFFYIYSLWIHACVDGDKALLQAMPSIIKDYPEARLIFKVQYDLTKEHFSWAKPYVNDNNLKDHVYWISGMEPYKNISRYYNRANLYASVGGVIGFEYPFVEANSCGLPVLGLNAGTTPEIIRDGYNGVLCNNYSTMKKVDMKAGIPVEETYLIPSSEEIAEKIKLLIGDSHVYDRYSLNGIEAAKRFDINDRIKDLSKILETI